MSFDAAAASTDRAVAEMMGFPRVELIPADGQSLAGEYGVRMFPVVDPEVAAAEEAELMSQRLGLDMEGL